MNEVNERVTPIGNEFYGGDPSSLRPIERMPLIAAWLAFHLLERSVSFHCHLFSYVGCSAKCQNKLTANIFEANALFHPLWNARQNKSGKLQCKISSERSRLNKFNIIPYSRGKYILITIENDNKTKPKNKFAEKNVQNWKMYANFMHQIIAIIRNLFEIK